ncbi:MAG: hypothetical protein ABI649_01895 [Gaiellaceae bacterium]
MRIEGRRLCSLLAVALFFAVAASTATAAIPRVTAATNAPLVAAAGDKISVKATISGTGKRFPVALIFGNPAGSAKKGLKLGTGITVSHRGIKRLVVPGKVPLSVVNGKLGTLLVCVNPTAALKGTTGLCRKAAAIATSGKSAEERIAGAKLAGRITAAKAVLFGLYSLRFDPRLPKELQGAFQGPGGDLAAINAAADSFGTLPVEIQERVFPYFVPPQAGGSAWRTAGRNWGPKAPTVARARAGAAAAAAATPDCTGYQSLESGTGPTEEPFPWQGIPTSDGNAIVWYGTTETPQWEAAEASDRASALKYAAAMPEIWTKLTAEFGVPKSDGAEACYHGPDGKFDIYVGSSIVLGASRFDSNALAVTAPYPAVGNFPTPGKWCTNRPSWIAMQAGLPNWALAHEFMHALQFSHKYVSCEPPIAWWDEGGATWAGNFVYPDDDYEETHYPGFVKAPLADSLEGAGYEAWPFWRMLEKTVGLDSFRAIFAAMATKRPVPAVDGAISGGFDKQLSRYFLHAYNQSPVGDAGFDIAESFKTWDNWTLTPDIPAALTVNLGGAPVRTDVLKMQRAAFPRLSVGSYHKVDIADENIKEIQFTNDLVGKPGGHVDALLHLADDTWKLEDWSKKKTVTLCRDKEEEDVQNLVIVSSNTGVAALPKFAHKLRVRNNCPHAYKILAASQTELSNGQYDWTPDCPTLTGTETATGTYGPQPFHFFTNNFFADPLTGDLVGNLVAVGTKSVSTVMHGCDLATDPPSACTRSGSGTNSGGVQIQVSIPNGSPTAEVLWFLDDPAVGLGSEGGGTSCFITVIGWTLTEEEWLAEGTKSVPREVFESDTPQTISIDVDFDLTGPIGTTQTSETYSMTIQRVNEDGSPLNPP